MLVCRCGVYRLFFCADQAFHDTCSVLSLRTVFLQLVADYFHSIPVDIANFHGVEGRCCDLVRLVSDED